MSQRVNQDVALGLAAAIFGLVIVFVWAPLDSDTGLAEKIRGRWAAGDALAPTVAGAIIAAAGLAVALGGILRAPAEGGLAKANLRYLGAFLAVLIAALLTMRYAGPLAAAALGEEYRLLRDGVPWKYIGFVLGGGGMIFALAALAEGGPRITRLILAFAIAGALALAYDLPFEDLLMPPNGDV